MTLQPFFDSYYRLRPVNATFTGVHDYDDRLPDWSRDGLAAAADEMRTLRSSLDTAPDRGSLQSVVARDRRLACSFLDVQIAEIESGHFYHRNPSLVLGEAAFGLISLMTRPFANVAARADSAAARLSRIPALLDDARQAISRIPDAWRAKALRECEGVERLIERGLPTWIDIEPVAPAQAKLLTRAAPAALSALAAFRDWLARDAAASANDALACGPELFDLLLARGHWFARSRTALAAEAAAALDDALAQLHRRAGAAAPGGWPEVQQRLARTHPTVEDYLATYEELWRACRERADEARLLTWPDYPIRYTPIPRQTRDAAPFLYYLHYRSPAPYDRVAVHDYMVTPIDGELGADEQERRLRATNTSVIKLNHVVHHGAIGHHVQNFRAYAGASEIGRVAAVDCASRIGMFLGGTMAEGWACYATDLMDEYGFFTADESIAQQHTRARLLARALVDIRLHERSFTFDDAVAVYRDALGMADEAAQAEACKNSMFPGTAVMYWLGTSGLHELRAERARIEGAAFSLRAFHDQLLAFGSIPVPLIARAWS